MASPVALNGFSEAEKMIGNEHLSEKADVISLRDRRRALLQGKRPAVEIDGQSLPIVTNGNCTAEEVSREENGIIDRFKLSDLLATHSDVELPEHDLDNEVLQKISVAEKVRDVFKLFVVWLQNPSVTFEDFLKITNEQYRGVKQQSKPAVKQYQSISIEDLKSKLGLNGNEYLLFPNSHFANALSVADSEDYEIRSENGVMALKKGKSFYPLGEVEEMLVMANIN